MKRKKNITERQRGREWESEKEKERDEKDQYQSLLCSFHQIKQRSKIYNKTIHIPTVQYTTLLDNHETAAEEHFRNNFGV